MGVSHHADLVNEQEPHVLESFYCCIVVWRVALRRCKHCFDARAQGLKCVESVRGNVSEDRMVDLVDCASF